MRLNHLLFIGILFGSTVFATTANDPKVFGGASVADRAVNPAISVNGLFLGGWGPGVESGTGFRKGLQVQEIEASFTGSVDPYFFGNLVLGTQGAERIYVREGYFQTLGLPYVTIKGGKFFANFGKNNPLHNHLQPLIDRPLLNRVLLGDGMNSVGAEASVLMPVPWYFDLSVGAISAKTLENARPVGPFQSNSLEQLAVEARMEHHFDLSEATSLSLGGSFASGDNKFAKTNQFGGGDVTLKYRTGKSRGDFAIAWISEFLYGQRNGWTDPDWSKAWGFYSTVLVRLDARFWVGLRGDFVRMTAAGVGMNQSGENVLFAYVPSEATTLRFQGGAVQTPGKTGSDVLGLVQFNMTLGSHPGHAY